ncbi:MAG: chromate efflux transporter [Leadbetterella sp.]
MTQQKRIRHIIFLREVLWIGLTCIGGPTAHLGMFLKKFVTKRNYLSSEELLELQALCSILPGPTSTQIVAAIGYRLGGRYLALMTLLIWILPACTIMGFLAISLQILDPEILQKLTVIIKPMAIAFVIYSVSSISLVHIQTKTSLFLMLFALALGIALKSPYMTPVVIFIGGLVASLKFRQQQKNPYRSPIAFDFKDIIIWGLLFLVLVFIGTMTQSLPIRVFENFYRNGSFAFGGGHVLKPLLYNEFVEFKKLISKDDFLTGISISEIIPGPTFSISSYLGALTMKSQGVFGQILGAFVGSLGIFLPGIFMMFFAIKFWDSLKQYRGIRASLEGVNAASIGLTYAAGISLFMTVCDSNASIFTVLITLVLLYVQKIPPVLLISGGVLIGYYL